MFELGKVVGIYISTHAGLPMEKRVEITALKGLGLEGDRYASGSGSFNTGSVGKRQVTLIDAESFRNSGFTFEQSRRNIITSDIDLMGLIGCDFQIGLARFRGIKYCTPCQRPSELSRIRRNFQEVFADSGGIIAEVVVGGVIRDRHLIFHAQLAAG